MNADTNAHTGTCVLVDGVMVAWFANFDEVAEDWCRENYFGRWMTWRASLPTLIPLTPEQREVIFNRATELLARVHRSEATHGQGD